MKNNLRFAREQCGLTVQQAATRAGVTKACLYAIEAGMNSPKIDTLAKLADAYGVTLTDLLLDGGTDHKPDQLRRMRVHVRVLGPDEEFNVDVLAYTPQHGLNQVKDYTAAVSHAPCVLKWEWIDA